MKKKSEMAKTCGQCRNFVIQGGLESKGPRICSLSLPASSNAAPCKCFENGKEATAFGEKVREFGFDVQDELIRVAVLLRVQKKPNEPLYTLHSSLLQLKETIAHTERMYLLYNRIR